jgi:hypothetical protein
MRDPWDWGVGMTEQEAYALGWHASQRDLKNEDVSVNGKKETWAVLDGECPLEILEDNDLHAAWTRGHDEGCVAIFDRAVSPT